MTDKSKNVRDSIYVELLKFLRAKNTTPSRASFWDRPIVVTLVGGVLLTIVTTLWTTIEGRRENAVEYRRAIFKDVFIMQQIELMTKFPKAYDNTGTVINSWLAHILWVAEEKNLEKPRSDTIEKWEAEIKRLQQKYESTDPLEGILKQIQVVFACQAVRNSSQLLYEKWRELIALHLTANRDYNDGEEIENNELIQYESERKAILEKLEELKDLTVDGMSHEMASIRVGRLECPP